MKTLRGISAMSGIVKGTVCMYSSEIEDLLPHYAIPAEQVDTEVQRIYEALDDVANNIHKSITLAEEQLNENAAEIFKTHLRIIQDKELIRKIEEQIRERMINAEHAINDAFDRYIQHYQQQKGHFQELTHDFVDARNRFLKSFDIETSKFMCPVGDREPVIVAAKRLTPSMVLHVPRQNVVAFVTEQGGFTSHATILARSHGVPMVFGIDVEKELECGRKVIVNGSRGIVIVDPDKKTEELFASKMRSLRRHKQLFEQSKHSSSFARKRKQYQLKLNINTPEEFETIKGLDHDGIGLLRTEFLFFSHKDAPGEEEQYTTYKNILSYESSKPVTVRLLDLGEDKFPPFLAQYQHFERFASLRGALAAEIIPEIYVTQMRALLRANENSNLRILYPMVSDVSDLETFRKLLHKAKSSLRKEKIKFRPGIQEGVMIETPAAVMMARELMDAVDFVNIGTNDLFQYTLAASRENLFAEKRYHIFHPALVRMLEMIANHGKTTKKEACLCGEIASFEELYPLLLQVGIRSFSVGTSKHGDIQARLFAPHKTDSKTARLTQKYLSTKSKVEADRFLGKMF
jgi:phosphotransferase system enzyme I (PtsI)